MVGLVEKSRNTYQGGVIFDDSHPMPDEMRGFFALTLDSEYSKECLRDLRIARNLNPELSFAEFARLNPKATQTVAKKLIGQERRHFIIEELSSMLESGDAIAYVVQEGNNFGGAIAKRKNFCDEREGEIWEMGGLVVKREAGLGKGIRDYIGKFLGMYGERHDDRNYLDLETCFKHGRIYQVFLADAISLLSKGFRYVEGIVEKEELRGVAAESMVQRVDIRGAKLILDEVAARKAA